MEIETEPRPQVVSVYDSLHTKPKMLSIQPINFESGEEFDVWFPLGLVREFWSDEEIVEMKKLDKQALVINRIVPKTFTPENR